MLAGCIHATEMGKCSCKVHRLLKKEHLCTLVPWQPSPPWDKHRASSSTLLQENGLDSLVKHRSLGLMSELQIQGTQESELTKSSPDVSTQSLVWKGVWGSVSQCCDEMKLEPRTQQESPLLQQLCALWRCYLLNGDKWQCCSPSAAWQNDPQPRKSSGSLFPPLPRAPEESKATRAFEDSVGPQQKVTIRPGTHIRMQMSSWAPFHLPHRPPQNTLSSPRAHSPCLTAPRLEPAQEKDTPVPLLILDVAEGPVNDSFIKTTSRLRHRSIT